MKCCLIILFYLQLFLGFVMVYFKIFYIKTNSYLTFKKVVRFRGTLSVHQHIYISITLFAKMRNLCNLVINLFAHIEIAQLFFDCKKIPCIMYQIVSKVWTFILSSTVPKSNNVVVIDAKLQQSI